MDKPNRDKRNQMPPPGRRNVLAISDNRIGVDRENRIVHGRVVAELGPFKSKGRGEFNLSSLERIVDLGNSAPGGLKSRFKHPTMSDDGLGKYLGRDKNFRLDGDKVRADFHIADVAMQSPPEGGGTPYGEYILNLASNDPGALSSSLVLDYKSEYQLEPDGKTRAKDDSGELLPPVWLPTKLWAIDVVDTGDAVNDFLSMDDLSENDKLVRQVASALDSYFSLEEMDRESMETRIDGFKHKFLAYHFGEPEMPETDFQPIIEGQNKISENLAALGNAFGALAEKLGSFVDATQQKPEAGIETEQPLSGADLTKKIVALCKAVNKSDLALEFIEEGLGLEQVKDRLLSATASERNLTSDATGGENHSAPASKQSKLETQIQSEWDEGIEVYSRLGITRDSFVKSRRIELGLDSEPSRLLLENGSHSPVVYVVSDN
jgi:hypothetical protein